ncbi:methyltransferase family protein [Kiloniella sp.]|uniref:methyltransferase family protein n=1 Tax=Kiloniella sp. TaxID=1938587 RepID=UPI003A93950C
MQRLLPPFFFLVCVVMMALLSTYYPILRFLEYPWTLIGILDLIGGLSITLIAGVQFMRAKTNLKTFNRPDQFITTGLFRVSRNPMYLGLAISTFGVALYLGALSPFLICALFITVVDRWYISYEEKMMAETFAQAYMDYKAKVRRWV